MASPGSNRQAIDVRIFDGRPRALTSVNVPATALTGQPVTMQSREIQVGLSPNPTTPCPDGQICE